MLTSNLHLEVALPALIVALGATLLFLVDLFVGKDRKAITVWLALAIIGLSALFTIGDFNHSTLAFNGMMRSDAFTGMVNLIVLTTVAISILVSYDYMKRTKIERSEFYPLLLLTSAGAMFMGAANDLVIVFVALELLSIPLYILAGFRRPDPRSEESAMKYFLLGAFATGFLVYGIALVYGATGATNLQTIFSHVAAGIVSSNFLLVAGAGLLLVGLGFKVAAVPFHMWTPDVYQGAPTPVTAFMSVGAKIGGFAALLRVLTIALPVLVTTQLQVNPGQTVTFHATWQDTVSILAAITMILGNFVAITQKDIKRLLAYSSIANAGYIMMAVAAAGTFTVTADAAGVKTYGLSIAQYAIQGALIYLFAYAFTNIGAFAVAISVERDDASGTLLDDYAGLGRMKPMLAIAMTLFMLSLTGIPLTGGFMGKWFVFRSAIDANLAGLAVIGVLTSVVSAYYYLRVIVKMWLEPGESDAKLPFSLSSAVLICVIGTLVLGILPYAINLAQNITTAVVIVH